MEQDRRRFTGGEAREARPAVVRRAGHARELTACIARVLVLTGVLVLVYVTAPMEPRLGHAATIRLTLSLLVLALVVTWQIVLVARSPFPGLRAVEAITISVLLLVLSFSSSYVIVDRADPHSFTETLSRLDAVYFTVSVFATVGFGDIAARSDSARAAVTLQMIANMVLIGVVARVLVGTVQERRRTLDAPEQDQRYDDT